MNKKKGEGGCVYLEGGGLYLEEGGCISKGCLSRGGCIMRTLGDSKSGLSRYFLVSRHNNKCPNPQKHYFESRDTRF